MNNKNIDIFLKSIYEMHFVRLLQCKIDAIYKYCRWSRDQMAQLQKVQQHKFLLFLPPTFSSDTDTHLTPDFILMHAIRWPVTVPVCHQPFMIV